VQVTNKCTAGNTTLLISAIYAFGGTAYGGTEFCDNEDAADSGVCVESLMDRGGTPGNQEEGYVATPYLAPGRVAISTWYTTFDPTLYLGLAVLVEAGATKDAFPEVEGQPFDTVFFKEDGSTPCMRGDAGCMDQPWIKVGVQAPSWALHPAAFLGSAASASWRCLRRRQGSLCKGFSIAEQVFFVRNRMMQVEDEYPYFDIVCTYTDAEPEAAPQAASPTPAPGAAPAPAPSKSPESVAPFGTAAP
jgi:hypothetical protein